MKDFPLRVYYKCRITCVSMDSLGETWNHCICFPFKNRGFLGIPVPFSRMSIYFVFV